MHVLATCRNRWCIFGSSGKCKHPKPAYIHLLIQCTLLCHATTPVPADCSATSSHSSWCSNSTSKDRWSMRNIMLSNGCCVRQNVSQALCSSRSGRVCCSPPLGFAMNFGRNAAMRARKAANSLIWILFHSVVGRSTDGFGSVCRKSLVNKLKVHGHKTYGFKFVPGNWIRLICRGSGRRIEWLHNDDGTFITLVDNLL